MTTSVLVDRLQQRAMASRARVALPDALDPRVLEAAREVVRLELASPLLVGEPADIEVAAKEAGVELDGIAIVDPTDANLLQRSVERFTSDHPSFPASACRRMLLDPLYAAVMAVHLGEVDAMVAGLAHPTAEVLMACHTVLGLAAGIETPSSMFVLEVPNHTGPEGPFLAFADCAVVTAPTAVQLADIAIATAGTVRRHLGWEPRVALLSFSTRGSGEDPSVDRVVEALGVIRHRAPELEVDGELQADAALDLEVAAGKLGDTGAVAGRANVLIFPDLNAGNIGYKLVQRLCGARAYGPLLQGFAGHVCDLSRGATRDDIIGSIALTAVARDGG